jgi:hypothetical protein
MRVSLSILASLAFACCWSQSAAAQVEAGLRSGYAVPFGKATADASKDMNQGIRAAIPIWIDLGQRVTPNIFVGLNAQYGFGFVGDDLRTTCDKDNASCSTHSIRAGLEAHYHFLPSDSLDPWLGLGFGYEWWTLSISSQGQDESQTASGPELANFQLGLDWKPDPESITAVGPFASFSLGEFLGVSCSGSSACPAVNDKSIHNWFVIGVRGVLGP